MIMTNTQLRTLSFTIGQLFEAETINSLLKYTGDNFPKREDSASSVTVDKMVMIPNENTNTLLVKTNTTTSSGSKHKQEILFESVTFGGSTSLPGHNTTINKIGRNSNIKVNCTCADFYWRFATWNSDTDSLLGDPPAPYIKKSDRPPVNPAQSPGICKHLVKVINQLELLKIV